MLRRRLRVYRDIHSDESELLKLFPKGDFPREILKEEVFTAEIDLHERPQPSLIEPLRVFASSPGITYRIETYQGVDEVLDGDLKDAHRLTLYGNIDETMQLKILIFCTNMRSTGFGVTAKSVASAFDVEDVDIYILFDHWVELGIMTHDIDSKTYKVYR